MSSSKIAVLGAGPASQALAADLALQDQQVHFWGRNRSRLLELFENREIKLIGVVNGTARLAGASDDLARTLRGARMVFVVLPANAQHDVAAQCASHAEDGQTYIITCHGGMGSLVFARAFRHHGVRADVLFADLPPAYGARFLRPGVVSLPNRRRDKPFGPKGIGVFPARRAHEVIEALGPFFPGYYPAVNALDEAFLPTGPVLHPSHMLMNAASIETHLYWDAEGRDAFASTPAVRRVTRALDEERKAAQRAWGFPAPEIFNPQFMNGELDGAQAHWGIPDPGHEVRAAFKDLLSMQHRFVAEDVPTGLVLRISAAERAGIDMPVSRGMCHIFSVINDVDYFATGRTLDSLGLEGMTVEDINTFLADGWY